MDNNKQELNPLIFKIGQRIQKYRLQRNLTQEQLAEAINVSQKHLSRIENGYHNPRFDMVIQIANALNVPVDVFARDVPDDDVDVFLADIRSDVESMNSSRLKFLKKMIGLILEMDNQTDKKNAQT